MADQIPDSAKLLPCPFCGATPHRGLEKARHCQMHGDTLQDYSIWCPKGHAKLTERSEAVAIAAWNTRAAPPAMDREAVERIYVRWSDDGQFIRKWSREPFADGEPVDAIGRPATDGEALSWRLERIMEDGGPLTLSDKAILRDATAALSTLSADAIRQGKATFRPYSEWNEDDRDVLWWKLPVQQAPYVGSPLDLGFAVGAHLYNQFGEVIGRTEANVGGWPFSASDEADLVWSRLPATPASHASDGGKA